MSKLPVALSHSPNYVSAILDEIALEGLDGITPVDLWLRLSDRPNFPIQQADEESKNVLWNVVKRMTNVAFYELPEARSPLILFDRYENVDPYLGMVMEPEILPVNIYPHAKVDDFVAGVMGSCATYNTRIDVTSEVRKLTYKESFDKWGHKLVVVANQAARNRALRNPDVNPNLELTVMQYCVLERVGRSRYHGDVTQGKVSLQLIGEDAKTLFYHRKVLQKQRLITKQMFHQKLGAQNCSGLLLHLPRFFVERKPKALVLTEQIITFLKTQRNETSEYDKIRSELNLGNSLKKIMKTFNFQKYVRTDVISYRSLHPDAKESEWKCKGSSKEKVVRVLQLLDAKMDVKDIWAKYDDIYEDDDEERSGYLDEGSRLLDRTMFSQAFRVVDSAGPDGLSQIQMGVKLGVTKLQSRAICRKLIKTKATSIFMSDMGRQRVTRFVSKRFDNNSKLGQQFSKEKARMRELVSAQSKTPKIQTTDSDNIYSISQEIQALDPHTESSYDKYLTSLTNNEEMIEVLDTVDEHLDNKNSPEQFDECEKIQSSIESSNLSVSSVTNDEAVQIIQAQSKKKKRSISQDENKVRPTIQKKRKVDNNESTTTNVTKTSTADNTPVLKKRRRTSSVKEVLPKKLGKNIRSNAEDIDRLKEDMQIIEMEVVEPKMQVYSKTIISGLVEEALNGQDSPNVTSRLLKRANMIIEAVQEHKVIFDLSKLQKMISEEETKEGCDGRMDKKSLQRILFKLATDGHVKNLQVKLKGYGKEKLLTFVCHPNVTNDHSVIQSAIEQAKMKFVILNREMLKKHGRNPKISKDITSALFAEGKGQKVPSNLKYNSRIGRTYGFCPKFLRMQVLHKVMFYLIYGYEGIEELDQLEALKAIKEHYNVTEDVRNEISQIYVPVIDWKMFIPPLPKHSGYLTGWCLMSDLLLRLPLSIFLQLVNVMYEVPELEQYLNHPIRKHLLVKNLPLHIRKALTVARKYIFTIHELITRLCFMGLAQVGPQSLKEKDQVFIYINRNAQLSDTSSSSCGYHKVSQDIDYPIHRYKFETSANVEHFWYDCWNFCMHTLLGGRLCLSGKEVVLETLVNKPCMIEAIEPRNIDEVIAKDVGYVPGDNLGAAGLDSAMFAHLKRNWYWTTQDSSNSSNPSSTLTSLHTAVKKVKDADKKTTRKVEFVRVKPQTSSAVAKKHRRIRDKKKDVKEKPNVKPKRAKLLKDVTVRLLKPRKSAVRKPYYDQVDREALLKMNKLRVDWSPVEDNLLLLCKVASVILCSNAKNPFHNFVVVREVLHSAIPESSNKTSRACQRRTNYVMKNPQTQRSVNLCVEEIKQDQNIMERFGNILKVLHKTENGEKLTTLEKEEKWNEEFKKLVDVLYSRFKKIHSQSFTSMSEGFIIPDTIEEFVENFRVIRLKASGKLNKTFHEVKTVGDIYYGVINAIIHSSLNTSADKTSWAYQLFNIYQHYPDKLLRAVMSKTRSDQMISLRKSYLRSHLRSGNYLPLSASPYQLSISYLNLMTTRYQFELYNDCIETYNQLKERWCDMEQEHEVVAFNGGSTALLVEFMTHELLNFSLEIPDQVIILDPTVAEKDETYARIVKRYQDILASYKDQELTSSVLFDDNYKPTAKSSLKRNIGDELKVNPPLPTSQQNVVAKAATRIALYLTREDCDSGIEQQELQHAHDFFVVNSSKVFCSLAPKEKSESNELPSSLIPLSHSVIQKTLAEVDANATFIDRGLLNPELYEALNKSQIGVKFAHEVIEFVNRKKEVGATVADIREKYGVTKEITNLLTVLVEKEVFLRCGVTTTHYVHHAFTRPWLVRSYHLQRREREAMTKTNAKILEIDKTDTEYEPLEKNKLKTVSHKAEETAKSEKSVADKTHIKTDTIKGIIKKSAAFDPKLKSNVNVCIRPWIRVDGTVNRRILDRTLSSVLGHIMVSPGCSLKHLQERFSPALQPHHTRELAEILQKLKCVQFKSIKVSHKISLFSKPTTITTSEAFGLECEDNIIFEPEPLAVTRLGSFIAESVYSKKGK